MRDHSWNRNVSTRSPHRSRSVTPTRPSLGWAFDALAPDLADRVDRLLSSIADLSEAEWLRIGHDAMARPESDGADGQARARLTAAIADHQLEFVSWFVRDAVDAAAQQLLLAIHPHDRHWQAAVRLAREVLYCAVMAEAAGDHLSAFDYGILSAAWRACTAR